jgi:hypothetical protein
MLSQIGLLFWVLIGSSVAGMVILSGLDLPPAGAVVRPAGAAAALPDRWTFPPGCFAR